MTNSISLSRAVAAATAALGSCLLVCALLGTLACPAAAFTPLDKHAAGGENTPLNLGSSTTSAAHSSSGSGGGASVVRTIVGLAIVIAVIWGLAWVLRQVKAGRDPHVSSAGLTSLAALTLSSGRSVHLVRAGRDYLLLGSAEHGVVPIHRYTEQEARDAGLVIAEMPRERSRIFAAAGTLVGAAGAAARGEEPQERWSTDRAWGESVTPQPRTRRAIAADRGADPMRMPSPSSGLIERLRQWTVRR